MINQASVFEAVHRGYTELQYATPEEICNYFSNLDPETLSGHINNIKGIVFELEVVNALNKRGIEATMFDETNHPITDIMIMDEGDIVSEMQLKATDSVAYISDTLEANPDVCIITTNEVASAFDNNDLVINSGIDNEFLTKSITETLTLSTSDVVAHGASDSVSDGLFDSVSDFAVPISPIGIGVSILTGGLCFITTAVCNYLRKKDNCHMLNSFRLFRDHWLAKQPDGPALIATYYQIAPDIVCWINQQPNQSDIYQWLNNTYLQPCYRMIKKKDFWSCKNLYIEMVEMLLKIKSLPTQNQCKVFSQSTLYQTNK